jgi:hypothetical protein
VILQIFNDDRLAEIVLDRSATPEHVLDAMDLCACCLAHGVTAARIIRTNNNPVTKASGGSAV